MNNKWTIIALKGNKKKKGKAGGKTLRRWMKKKIQTHIALLTCKHKPNNLQLQTTCILQPQRTLENIKHT